MTMLTESPIARSQPASVDELLQQKRASVQKTQPSDGFWDNTFAPRFARKMMAALGRPQRNGRTLTIVGWATPFVFATLFAVAVAVAYIFSPQRAIARWEKAAGNKQYVVDAMKDDSNHGKPYAVDAGQNALKAERTEGVSSYQFTAASDRRSDF